MCEIIDSCVCKLYYQSSPSALIVRCVCKCACVPSVEFVVIVQSSHLISIHAMLSISRLTHTKHPVVGSVGQQYNNG